MRPDAAKIIESLGFTPVKDFVLSDDGGNISLLWFSSKPKPTEAEIDAAAPNADAAIKALKDGKEPDLAVLRDQATQAVVDINTFLAIASPSNAQVLAEVKAIDQRQRAIIKALARLAIKTLG